ncbi:hypothetical protein ACFLU3_05260 [Chloroflexota bacterium]
MSSSRYLRTLGLPVISINGPVGIPKMSSFEIWGGGYGNGETELHGREAVREWYTTLRNTYPSCHAIHYPSPWQVIDEERGWIVMEWLTRMRDPGDGSIHEEKNYSHLKYAGNKQFSYQEDIYNPQRHLAMVQRWMDVY